MKNKLMVLGKIVSEAIKFGHRYATAESRVFNKIYGKTPGPSAARGARHGLVAGGYIGSVITGTDLLAGDGTLQKDEHGNKAGSPNKARGGFKRYSSRRNYTANKFGNKCRCPSSRKYNRM